MRGQKFTVIQLAQVKDSCRCAHRAPHCSGGGAAASPPLTANSFEPTCSRIYNEKPAMGLKHYRGLNNLSKRAVPLVSLALGNMWVQKFPPAPFLLFAYAVQALLSSCARCCSVPQSDLRPLALR